MKLLVRKIYIYSLVIATLPIYGMEQSPNLSDEQPVQPQQQLGQSQQLELLREKVDVISYGENGSRISRVQYENLLLILFRFQSRQDLSSIENRFSHCPDSTQRDIKRYCRQMILENNWKPKKDQQDNFTCFVITPAEFHQEHPLIRTIKLVLNNPVVIKLAEEVVPPMLISLLPHYSFASKREKKLDEELIFQEKRKEETLKKLKDRREKLKEDPAYFKQIMLYQTTQKK